MNHLLQFTKALTPGGFLHTRSGQILRLDRVTFIEAIRAAARIHHLDGDPVEAADDHQDLFARLEKDPGWIRTDLVLPTNFTPEDVEIFKYSLVQPDDSEEEPVLTTEIGKWLRKTGGINGEPYGLETDALMLDRGR